MSEYPSDFASNLDDVKELWMTGTHHSSAMTAYYHLFETKVKNGGSIKALLVDPDGIAYKMAAMRFRGKAMHSSAETSTPIARKCNAKRTILECVFRRYNSVCFHIANFFRHA